MGEPKAGALLHGSTANVENGRVRLDVVLGTALLPLRRRAILGARSSKTLANDSVALPNS